LGWRLRYRWRGTKRKPFKGEGRTNTSSVSKLRFRSALVVGETALALLLLVGAGLLLKSFIRLQNVNPGFDPRGVMTALVVLPPDQYAGGREQSVFYRAVLASLRAIPGIVVGVGDALPTARRQFRRLVRHRRTAVRAADEPPFHGDRRYVSPGYLEALSIHLRRGRYFTDEDRIGVKEVIIIDERLARQYWPDQDPMGQRMKLGQTAFTIVGIVGHVKHRSVASDSDPGAYYLPLFQRSSAVASIVVKTPGIRRAWQD
jgi:hypothetical protein